jgi:sugar fermentation stimulation protein A
MKYNNVKEGIFLSRKNRFIANVEIDGKMELCHVKNTGRCRELFIEGTKAYVERNDKPDRKTKFSLIAVEKEGELVNVDSSAPNRVVREWLQKGNLFSFCTDIRQEVVYGNSRFDFYVEAEKPYFIEVKGVTLEENKIARFPDAPTQRGVKHMKELCRCAEEGYGAGIIFVVQMKKAECFVPNDRTHPEFGYVLREAKKAGVFVKAVNCLVEQDSLEIFHEIKIELGKTGE